jgi:sulfopyruvate decarboxylase subunit beta
MMKRDEMFNAFARQRKDEIVVAVHTAAQEIAHISPNELNYTFLGAMGQGSSHALGLALGRPDRRVILFDRDGSLLMNLGSLVTIANQAPTNLVHCPSENGCYETNGSVSIPRAGQIRFAELAKLRATVRRTRFPISPSGKASCQTCSKKQGRFSSTSKSKPAKSIPRISRG